MDDNMILTLFWNRDESGIAAIAYKYGQCLSSIAKNILMNAQEVEECVNDTYLALWNTIPPQRPKPLLSYAARITRNHALKQLRARNALRRRCDYDLSLDELAECIGHRSLEEEMSVRQLGQCINAFLGTLKTEHCQLFLRRYWFGDSITQLAEAFHKSENAISIQLTRIRNKLREYLIQEGYYEE